MAKWTTGVAGAAILMIMASAAQAAPFDARKPADMVSVLKSAGAAGELKTDGNGKLYFDGSDGELVFSLEFRDCNDASTLCNAGYFMASWDMDSPPLATLNLWNDVTYFCAAFQGSDGDPFLKMGLRPKASDTQADVAADYESWMLCVDEFRAMLADPDGFTNSIDAPSK